MEYFNFEVKFDTSFGLEASFQCQDIDVQTCDSDGSPLYSQMKELSVTYQIELPGSQTAMRQR